MISIKAQSAKRLRAEDMDGIIVDVDVDVDADVAPCSSSTQQGASFASSALLRVAFDMAGKCTVLNFTDLYCDSFYSIDCWLLIDDCWLIATEEGDS